MIKIKPQAKTNLAKLGLLLATIIWGSGFTVMKNTLGSIPTHLLLAIRFTSAAILLSIVFYKKLKNLNKDYIIHGSIIGVFLFLAYSFQTMGLNFTTPGKNAFLTAIYCVLVPFLFWITNKRKPDVYNFSAAIFCIIGIGFVSLTDNFTIEIGDTLSIICGLMFCFQIIAIANFAQNKDPVLLTIIQFTVTAILSWIVFFCSEKPPESFSTQSILCLAYLSIFSTAIALLLQNVGQKFTHPSAAAIIMSLEAVFGVVFSVIFNGEHMSSRLIIGFALIFIAIIISETKLSFLKRKPVAGSKKVD